MMTALFILFMGYLGVEVGASFPWSGAWQNRLGGKLRQTPEMLMSGIIAWFTVEGWSHVAAFEWYYTTALAIFAFACAYGGIQAATWPALRWWKQENKKYDNRGTTLKPFVDWLAALFGKKLGDESYSWLWMATKGFITTIPMLCIGTILAPLGCEIGSHARGRFKGDLKGYMEFTRGAAYGVACVFFLWVCTIIGSTGNG